MSEIAPHRCFVSAELPFCVPVTRTRSSSSPHIVSDLQGEKRKMVEAFIPPWFSRACLDEVTTGLRPLKEITKQSEESLLTTGKALQTDVPEIGKASEYHVGEVFSGWRPLDFSADSANLHTQLNPGRLARTAAEEEGIGEEKEKGTGAEKLTWREEMLRESFPSFTPQLLLHGFYRNDVLVDVTRTRRLKRLRDKASGNVVEEVYLQEDAGANPAKATVVGVVSREITIARPADFCFAPFSKDAVTTAPAHCSANMFPPAHLLAEKTPFEVGFTFGEYIVGKNLSKRGAETNVVKDEKEEPSQKEFEVIPTLYVVADDPNIPPPMLSAQKEIISRLNGGDYNDDCLEVKTVKSLLEERPLWNTKCLLEAILQSGTCPRKHINKKIMSCLTYVIRNGPFNRLRIRLGFDPYASYTTAPLQRLAVKINRRSELGIFLRDISRVPHIADALKEVAKSWTQQSATDASNRVSLLYRPRSTLFQELTKVICDGRLYLALQFIDLCDDPFLRSILDNVPEAASMPLWRRSEVNGWIGEAGYNRATTYITDVLLDLIKKNLAPELERLRRNPSFTEEREKRCLISGSLPTLTNTDCGEDAASFSSAASSAFSSFASSLE